MWLLVSLPARKKKRKQTTKGLLKRSTVIWFGRSRGQARTWTVNPGVEQRCWRYKYPCTWLLIIIMATTVGVWYSSRHSLFADDQEDPWNGTHRSRIMTFEHSRDQQMWRVNELESRDHITGLDHKFWSQILITLCDQNDHKVWSTWSQSVINLITLCDQLDHKVWSFWSQSVIKICDQNLWSSPVI